MPMYFDTTKVKKRLTSGHLELAMQFLEAIRGRDYSKRGFGAPVDELAIDDITDELVATWAYVRRVAVKLDPHVYFHHREGLANDHDHVDPNKRVPQALVSTTKDGVTTVGHGHIIPPLFIVAEGIQADHKKNPIDEREFERARRDLIALAGLRVASSRAKVSPEAVFGE